MWYVGVDWADTHHDVLVLDDAGRRVGSRRVAHSQEGLNDLKAFVLNIAASPENVACILAHESWTADCVSSGSRVSGLSGQPEDR